MKRLIAYSVLVGILTPVPARAADSIYDQAVGLALQQPAPEQKPPRRSPGMYWGGAALAGVGGAILGWAIPMQHEITCNGFGSFVTCLETGTNKGALLGAGAALMASGMAISIIGGQRVSVAPSRRGVTASYRW